MTIIQIVAWYSDHHLNAGPVFKWCSEYWTKFCQVFKWHSNTGLFSNQTAFDHLNNRLVYNSDPSCIILVKPCLLAEWMLTGIWIKAFKSAIQITIWIDDLNHRIVFSSVNMSLLLEHPVFRLLLLFFWRNFLLISRDLIKAFPNTMKIWIIDVQWGSE